MEKKCCAFLIVIIAWSVGVINSKVAVVGIDFGTARTGYGYGFSTHPNDVEVVPWIGTGADWKTFTNILLDSSNAFVAFGYEARNKYIQMGRDEASQHKFFEMYKMLLYTKPGSERTALATSAGGTAPVVDIISLTLKHVSDSAVDQLNRATLTQYTKNQVCSLQ